MRNRGILFIVLMGIIVCVTAQAALLTARHDVSKPGFPAIRVNKMQNTAGLQEFYEKLSLLKAGELDRVSILHIGDSHIQADYITRRVRQNLQDTFGNAGRGLVFPYAIGRTNGPTDVRTTGTGAWHYQRNSSKKNAFPTGIAGVSLTTFEPHARIDLRLSPYDGTDNPPAFTKLTLFHDKRPEAFEFTVLTPDGTICHDVTEPESEPQYTSSCVIPATEAIRLQVRDNGGQYARIYGITLENGKSGILYHAAGVNGASFSSFNRSVYFGTQLRGIKPDLIIISLGTNDVSDGNYSETEVRRHIVELLSTVRTHAPGAAVLFTTPPDFGKARNAILRNKELSLRHTIIDLCMARGLPYWDLFAVMGGHGSAETWKRYGLVQQDFVHFTRPGYDFIGRLFFTALMKGYEEYAAH